MNERKTHGIRFGEDTTLFLQPAKNGLTTAYIQTKSKQVKLGKFKPDELAAIANAFVAAASTVQREVYGANKDDLHRAVNSYLSYLPAFPTPVQLHDCARKALAIFPTANQPCSAELLAKAYTQCLGLTRSETTGMMLSWISAELQK